MAVQCCPSPGTGLLLGDKMRPRIQEASGISLALGRRDSAHEQLLPPRAVTTTSQWRAINVSPGWMESCFLSLRGQSSHVALGSRITRSWDIRASSHGRAQRPTCAEMR